MVRIDDLAEDPRSLLWPPWHGLPSGHPALRSYVGLSVKHQPGKPLGTLLFGHGDPGRFTPEHELLARRLAGRVGLAIERARGHEGEHRVAEVLQRALLPSELPVLSGVEVAVRYLPAGEHADVGGDWYDVTVLPDGDIALTVGDVVGHDITAAATMGELRNAIRVIALDRQGPAATLSRVHAAMPLLGWDRLATVVHAVLEPSSRRCSVARAGHVPPLLVTASGRTSWLDGAEQGGPPLGTGLPCDYRQMEVVLPPGSTLVLVTDGLLEQRSRSLIDGMAALEVECQRTRLWPPDSVCEHLCSSLLEHDPNDDVAMLVLRVPDNGA